MAAIYNWSTGLIHAKKEFTDKNGILRKNVIKSVELIYQGVEKVLIDGKEEEKKQSRSIVVNFDLIDLSLFQDSSELNNDIVLNWALNKLHPEERKAIEHYVELAFEDKNLNQIKIEFNE